MLSTIQVHNHCNLEQASKSFNAKGTLYFKNNDIPLIYYWGPSRAEGPSRWAFVWLIWWGHMTRSKKFGCSRTYANGSNIMYISRLEIYGLCKRLIFSECGWKCNSGFFKLMPSERVVSGSPWKKTLKKWKGTDANFQKPTFQSGKALSQTQLPKFRYIIHGYLV